MHRTLIGLALALGFASAAPAVVAARDTPLGIFDDAFSQRKDVDEVLLPQPPSGPASPPPYCNPSSPAAC